MTGFVQIIEFKTSHIEVLALLQEQLESATARHLTADRDRPGYFLSLAEFDSKEDAMWHDRPEAAGFATKMAELCDGLPRFYNLDVVATWQT